MKNSLKISEIAEKSLGLQEITDEEALFLVSEDIYDVLYFANKIRRKFKDNRIKTCAIVNSKSGLCSEDCKFCSQSTRYNTNVKTYPLLPSDEILKKAGEAKELKANGFSIVTSGRSISLKELNRICGDIENLKKYDFYSCASLGELTAEKAKKLKSAGLIRYHHNLETSENFFKNVCSTHTYSDRMKTVKIAKENGLEVCCGGIFGIGESWQDRIDLAFEIRKLDVDSIPLNFLNPRPGTPLENTSNLTPLTCLRIIAIFRFILPDKDIGICGGREINLRDLQSWMFYAGANSTMVGNYLTTSGRPAKKNIQMFSDLELNT